MKHKERGRRAFALVFDAGNDLVSGQTDFAGGNGLVAASFTAIREGDRRSYA